MPYILLFIFPLSPFFILNFAQYCQCVQKMQFMHIVDNEYKYTEKSEKHWKWF